MRQRTVLHLLAAPVLLLAAGVAWAQATPAGLWKTIDDNTKKEKSLVRIVESGGVYTGRVEKILDTTAPPDAVCKDCTDERKDKPVLGMVILRNLKQDPDDKEIWTGGDVLDPDNGKTYRARLKPLDEGKRLQLRGYLGPFYRTQVWQRVE